MFASRAFHLAARPLLSQHNRAAFVVSYNVERVLSDIDPDHSNCTVEFLWHGLLLDLAIPATFLAAGLEHDRTIPLAVIAVAALKRFSPDLNRWDSQRVMDERVFVH